MLFFRLMLCMVGLVLYLVIREFSDQPVAPTGHDAARQGQAAVVETIPPVAPWDSANIGTFQPVVAKPAAVP